MSKKILILTVDKSVGSFGGMGVQLKGVQSNSKNEFYEFHVSNDLLFIDSDTKASHIINHLLAQLSSFPDLEILLKSDVIHAFDGSTGLLGCALAKMLKKPLIVTIQLSMHSLLADVYNYDDPVFSSLEIIAMNKANAVIHVSQEYLYKYCGLNENSYYMPNGISLSHWQKPKTLSNSQLLKKLKKTNKLKLCFIGRFAKMKNTDALCSIDIPKDVNLYFVGSARAGNESCYENILNFCHQNKNANYVGALYDDQKIAFLQRMDAVIVPSIHEPFGIVCLEALASKSILLSSFESGMKEYLTEDIAINCGITKDSIENGIKKLKNLSQKEKDKRISEGLALCDKYSWKNSSKRLDIIYDDVLNNFSSFN